MIYSGMNLVNLRTMNRSKLLKLLNDRGPMPRKDISAELGLTPAAVTQICSELLEEGVLEEGGALEEEARVGRKKILIGLNYRYAYILGVCIESKDTTVFIGNLRGECLRRRVLKTDSGAEPDFCHGAPERLQARNIRTWADIPDSGLRKVLDKVIEKMADVTLNAERLLAPDRVICFGDLFRLSYFKQKFPEFYRKLDITYEEGSLEYSRLSSRTDYIGPLALVFNEILLQDR